MWSLRWLEGTAARALTIRPAVILVARDRFEVLRGSSPAVAIRLARMLLVIKLLAPDLDALGRGDADLHVLLLHPQYRHYDVIADPDGFAHLASQYQHA